MWRLLARRLNDSSNSTALPALTQRTWDARFSLWKVCAYCTATCVFLSSRVSLPDVIGAARQKGTEINRLPVAYISTQDDRHCFSEPLLKSVEDVLSSGKICLLTDGRSKGWNVVPRGSRRGRGRLLACAYSQLELGSINLQKLNESGYMSCQYPAATAAWCLVATRRRELVSRRSAGQKPAHPSGACSEPASEVSEGPRHEGQAQARS